MEPFYFFLYFFLYGFSKKGDVHANTPLLS